MIGTSLGLRGWTELNIAVTADTYLVTTFLTVLIGLPVAFFAQTGGGYLALLGFVAFTLVFCTDIAATGFGAYFP